MFDIFYHQAYAFIYRIELTAMNDMFNNAELLINNVKEDSCLDKG